MSSENCCFPGSNESLFLASVSEFTNNYISLSPLRMGMNQSFS